MGKVIKRIDAPLVAGLVVGNVGNAVDDGVAHIHVGRGHVNFCAQNPCSVRKFAGSHAAEKVKVFLNTAVSVGAFRTRLGEGASGLADFLGGKVADIGFSSFDKLNGTFVNEVKVA